MPSSLARPYLFAFAKDPSRRPVKTRLAKKLGGERARQFFELCLERLLGKFLAVEDLFVPVLLLEPLDGVEAFRNRFGFAGEVRAQAPGDLGQKLEAAFAEARGPALVVGTDLPELSREDLERAHAAMGPGRIVLGPSSDGGYFLLGALEAYPELFRAMPWSTPEVAEETRARARSLGLKVVEIPAVEDVDTLEDLVALRERLKHPDPLAAWIDEALLGQRGPLREEDHG